MACAAIMPRRRLVEVAWDALKTEVAVIAQHSLAWTNRRTFDAANSAIRIACDRRRIES
jgi:hypothetical protein